MKQPRTFWIHNKNHRNGSCSVWLKRSINGEDMFPEAIRVIDKAAFDHLVKELKALKEFAECHHDQQENHVIAHGLMIDVPHRIEVMLEEVGINIS